MSSPFELLERLRAIGVNSTVVNRKLLLRPGSRVPEALVPEIRHHRNGIVALLQERDVLGSWVPTTPDELVRHRRRVMGEEPRLWWWRPRYHLAELERSGMDRKKAVAKVRREAAAIITGTSSGDDQQHPEEMVEVDSD